MNDTFSSLSGFWHTVKATFGRYEDPIAWEMLEQPVKPVHAHNPLVQIETESLQETRF